MRSSSLRVCSLVLGPVLAVCFGWGCARGTALDATPIIDEATAELDASWSATPAATGTPIPNAVDAGSSAKLDSSVVSSNDDAGEDGPSPPPPPPPAGAPKPTQGEVLVSEVMYDPSDDEPATEWIELYNAAAAARTLTGLTLVDGSNRTHVIGSGVTIAAGAYVVLARSTSAAVAAKVPAAAIVHEYGVSSTSSGVQLANGSSGAVFLKDGTTTIARADYGGWFALASGRSIQLETLTYAASSSSAGWCLSQTPWASGADKGTPGAASDCP